MKKGRDVKGSCNDRLALQNTLLDLRKIPAPSDALSPFISHFSVVDDTTVSPPPEKMSFKLALVSSEGCELLCKSSLHSTLGSNFDPRVKP
jgi:hypothetical protein